MTGDDGQEHEFTIKDNILYNDEGESEDISAWVAHQVLSKILKQR